MNIFLDVYKTFTGATSLKVKRKKKVKKAKQQIELAKTKKLSAKQRLEFQKQTTIDLATSSPFIPKKTQKQITLKPLDLPDMRKKFKFYAKGKKKKMTPEEALNLLKMLPPKV